MQLEGKKMNISEIRKFLIILQNKICNSIETEENNHFKNDVWEKKGTGKLDGDGITRIIEGGKIIERGGVNFSHVSGNSLPDSATKIRPELVGKAFNALGLSLVFHPVNPFIPTVHMNIRFFCASSKDNQDDVWWFGGGMDLTPYYIFEEDAIHFHKCCKESLDPFSKNYYKKFKKACDDYFFIKHRNETRGIGGIFFDDFSELGFEKSFDLFRSVGNSFIGAYVPILKKRKKKNYGKKERAFQAYRRGRYVEFNLVYDRGTLFGLQSGGRIESILMSMPPLVNWSYNWNPEKNSPEEKLYKFLKPTEWINFKFD